MKNIIRIYAFLTFGFINAQQISSDFITDAEDWIVVGDATSAFPQYVADGGNSGGFISADDTSTGGVWYWSAPAKFLGDQSNSFGKTLSFDLKQSSINAQFDTDDLMISNDEITIVYDLADNPGTDWTSYSVILDTINAWQVGSIIDGQFASSEQIMAVLSNISSLKIRGEYVNGADTGGLDNVILAQTTMATDSFSRPEVRVYPNPTTALLNISNSENLVFYKIEIVDFLGKTISMPHINNSQIDLSSYSAGIYVVKFYSSEEAVQIKIIKQ